MKCFDLGPVPTIPAPTGPGRWLLALPALGGLGAVAFLFVGAGGPVTYVAGGMFEEDCEVWDSAGRLVAQSRQLARQPRPAG